MTYSFTVAGNVIPKGRPRFFRGRVITPVRTKNYEEWVAYHAKQVKKEPHDGPIIIAFVMYFKPPSKWKKDMREKAIQDQWPYPYSRGDIDNLCKSLLDAMNGISYIDDAQVIDLRAVKLCGEPRVEVSVTELPSCIPIEKK